MPAAPSDHASGMADAFLDLDALVVSAAAPKGAFIRGHVDNGAFVPAGDVEGPLVTLDAGHGEPGYLELGTRTFMSAREARLPRPPYVDGWRTERGFVPSSRSVHRAR